MFIAFFRFLAILFTFTAATVAQAGGAEISGVSQPQFRIAIKNSSLSSSISVILFNPNARAVEISYSECDFSYQLKHATEIVNYPMKEAFAFASPCPGSLNGKVLPANQAVVLFERKLNAESLRIVRMNGMKPYGEYHFRFTVLDTGKRSTSKFIFK